MHRNKLSAGDIIKRVLLALAGAAVVFIAVYAEILPDLKSTSDSKRKNRSDQAYIVNTDYKNDPETDIVYWVPDGEVYHKTPRCSYIRGKSYIKEGTIEEAADAGKHRGCSRCY